jgi:hypothetical protein
MTTHNIRRVVRSTWVLVLIAAAPWAWAQGTAFEATVDRNPVGVGEQCTLSFVLSNAGMGGGKNLQLPDLSRFRIMAGPSQSSSVQIINGSVSSTVTYQYVLQPKEAGKITIGAAAIEVGGKSYRTSPVTLEVVAGGTRPKGQAQVPTEPQVQVGDNLFLRAVVDRSHVLQGEQVNLQFRLYFRVGLVNYGIDKNPNMTGFWGEEIELPKNLQITTETFNGKQYRVGLLRKLALFPTRSGTLEISPMEVQVGVEVQAQRSNDPFDAFFRSPFGRTATVKVASEAVKVAVDPLPPGAPSDFKGAVGRFAMSAVTDRKTARTNEPVSLKVTISGTGNVKLLETPSIEFPPDFEQYSPKVTDNITRGDHVSGSKTFEYLVMPRYPGLKTIPPVTFSYFDLGKREYVRLRSPQIDLNVEQGAATAPAAIAGTGREDVRLLSQDIRFIKIAAPSLVRRGEYLHTNPFFIVLLLLPLAGVGAVAVLARRRSADLADDVGFRNRRAIRIARKGLQEADYLLQGKGVGKDGPAANQKLRFYTEVARAMWKYLGDKLNIPPAEISVATTVAELERRGVGHGIATAVKTLLESCEMARFAPTSLTLPAMQQTYNEARRIIVDLERTLR